MRQFKGIGKIYQFTFIQQVKAKGWKILTIVLFILCLALPAALIPLIGVLSDDEEEIMASLQTVYTVDLTEEEEVSFDVLNSIGFEGFDKIVYENTADLETAKQKAEADPHSLILVMSKSETGRYQLDVLTPEGSELSYVDSDGLRNVLNTGFSVILLQKSGLTPTQMLQMANITETSITTNGDEPEKTQEQSDIDLVKEILGVALPFVNIMILYFLVLMYGQGVANNVIIEKTSKLMDTFLVSVKPGAMMIGKVLAIVSVSVLQFASWILAVIAGIFAGGYILDQIHPNPDFLLWKVLSGIGDFAGMFTIEGILIAVLLVFGGFFLYCSLAALGGAIAGKPEDLSTTNSVFILILLASFFLTLFGGGVPEIGSSMNSAWMDWVPFTAVMITPSRVLLGEVSPLQGILSFGIIVGFSGLVLLFAGKVYRMMSLYKGKIPSPKQLIRMFKE